MRDDDMLDDEATAEVGANLSAHAAYVTRLILAFGERLPIVGSPMDSDQAAAASLSIAQHAMARVLIAACTTSKDGAPYVNPEWVGSSFRQLGRQLGTCIAAYAELGSMILESDTGVEVTLPPEFVPAVDPKLYIALTPAEVQSGFSRVKWAQGLIEQLPADHDGRNSWLLNYGIGPEAETLRVRWMAETGNPPLPDWPAPARGA
jgi:hypothetical protein